MTRTIVRRPRAIVPVSLALVLAMALSACGQTFVPPAAVVDGRRLEQDFLGAQYQVLLLNPQVAAQVGTSISVEKDFTRRLLAFLIETELVVEYAERHQVSTTQQDLSTLLATLVRQAGGRAKFNQALVKGEITMADVTANLRRQALIPKVEDAVVLEREGNSPTLLQAYKDQILQFMSVTVRSSSVKTKAAADQIRTTADAGGNVAWRTTTDTPGTDLTPDQQAAAKTLTQVGQSTVLGPTQAGSRWQVTRLEVKALTPFDQAKPQLLASRRDQEFVKWLRLRLAQAEIEVNPKFGTFDPKTAAITPITSTAA